MAKPFLIYGSYGYTGRLIAELAVRRGMQPILSGRDPVRLKAQAEGLGLEYRPVSLEDQPTLVAALKEVPLVLHCAGPFSHTYKSMVDACLQTGTHYLDITGEIPVFEAIHALDASARQAGLMLLPGIGFDVVPSDCLAAHLKRRLPSATHLMLSINTIGGGLSRGTSLTLFEGMAEQCIVRLEGKLVQVPLFSKIRSFDFGQGAQVGVLFSWGDISTSYFSTGIPNIEVYMIRSASFVRMLRFIRPFTGLVGKPFVQQWLKQRVMKSSPGPSAEARQTGHSSLWGEVSDEQGHRMNTLLQTPEGYTLTLETALAAVSRVLSGDFKPGFQTPSLAYGADFILEFEGVTRQDL